MANPAEKTMRLIYPVQTSSPDSGFSLIEVIVAVAIVAMTVAAASSSILISRKVEAAAFFYRDALLVSADVQAKAYYVALSADESQGLDHVSIEEELITSDPEGQAPAWIVYTVRSTEAERKVSFALKSGADN